MTGTALVIGGGIGGLAAATALAQRGVAVTLVEQAPEISEVGAGLQISPNGLAVLRALGVEADLDQAGAVQAREVVLENHLGGRQVARLDLTRLEGQRYLFVHRADLVACLLAAAQWAGVAIELGRRVARIQPGVMSEVHFADGSQQRAHLLVCADGLHSVGRAALQGSSEPFFTGQVAWRATVPASGLPATPRATVTMGPGRHIVRYPLRESGLINIVAVQERQAWAAEGWDHTDDPQNLRDAFCDFDGPVKDALSRVEKVNLWGLFRHPVAQTWHAGGTVLLGDAAHPTLPFLAQGANMALEDAWVLVEVATQGADWARYQARRKPRVEKVVAAATGNAWKYHLRPGPFRWAAHRALTLGSTLAPGLMMSQFEWLYGYDVTKAPE
ncbi:FAD-binding protein [Roseobacter denitrificans]|uniref:Monooxygenase, putative n=1 Tax=Roseobacter denitrificans (strain ATCC 33942 / OCh 114) TaxID=375451 RepID=Q165M2_ROSDO|nr:FAD-dependent monooxygenase [Roseobacter denitrificans]ABG32321.1 monooxygenase, putative [Roseobacter denitrificans OCh 114]AVL51800.1 FAD-binding protein [Roseobacter denitrificans]SFF80305.1 salicylate hydroxylase [Roseobacter denitrificans OCh 114]